MTVSTTNAVNNYIANGSQTVFAFTYQILTDQNGNPNISTVAVYVAGVLQNSGFTTSANSNQQTSPGGTVTFNTAPINGTTVQLLRNTPVTQLLSFPLEAKISTPALEAALDQETLIIQECEYQLSLKAVLPNYVQGDVLTWDPTGNTQNLVNQTPAQILAAVPDNGSGNVIGPDTSAVGNIAAFNNTNGQLLEDSGVLASSVFSVANPPPASSLPQGLVKIGGVTRGSATGSVKPLPNIPTGLAVVPTGTTGATSYTYKVVSVDAAGTTITAASAAVTTATGNATLSGTNFNVLSCNATAGAAQYQWYRTAGGATQGLIGTTTTPTLNDTGLAGNSATAPTSTTLVGDFWHTGNWSSDAPISSTRARIRIDGNLTTNATHTWTVNTEAPGGAASSVSSLPQGGRGVGIAGGDGASWRYDGGTFNFGAAGGGSAGSGGNGGTGTAGLGPSIGGGAYMPVNYFGGSGGGGGNANPGGGGGGGLYIESSGNISINANVTATGGNATNEATGGSGGGGGMILLRALGNITVASGTTINVSGGNGANGTICGGGGGGGGFFSARCSGVATTTGVTITTSGGTAGTGGSIVPTAGGAGSSDAVGSIGIGPRFY